MSSDSATSSLFSFFTDNSYLSTENPYKVKSSSGRQQTQNVIYRPKGKHRRTILFVFDQVPVVYDKAKYKEGPSKRTAPPYILNTPMAEYFQSLCARSVELYLAQYLNKSILDLDIAGKHRLEKSDTLASWISGTCFVFTHYCDILAVSTNSGGTFYEKGDTGWPKFTAQIKRYKPDIVVTLGLHLFEQYLQPSLTDSYLTTIKPGSLLGRILKCQIDAHKFQVVPTLDIYNAVYGNMATSYSYLSGYQSKLLATALLGAMPFSIENTLSVEGKRITTTELFSPAKHTPVLIDTIVKFDKLMDMLKKQPCVAIDTETASLYRVKNKLLTVQFAKCCTYGYIIPFQHFDSSFTSEEIEHVATTLRNFFEGDNDNQYHIYTNAQFDLTVLRNALKIRNFANKVWDIFAGEYALDENLKLLDSTVKNWYFSLLNISTVYGCDVYHTAQFSKEHRVTIETSSLGTALLEYCAFDVTIPYAIHLCQKKQADYLGYEKYVSIVTEQIGDMLQNFSCMEYTGIEVDIDYLFSLKGKDSPIEAEIIKLEKAILDTPAGIKANAILVKKSGVPSKGLFSNDTPTLLSLRKRDHLELLFFDILGISQDIMGKSGKRKLDAAFQNLNSDVAEVKMYTDLGKAKKLSSAYVNQFIKFWDTNEDFRGDHRIRPNYSFVAVVTGRVSARKPNLQQIPARSTLGKLIKRLFIASDNHLIIKADFSAHEVRNWGIISGDTEVANTFKHGLSLRKQYKSHPTSELAVKIKQEGDVHKLNASFFFGVKVEQVDPPLRNAVKGVIFGLIYGMAATKMSGLIKRTMEETKKIISQFSKRFTAGFGWFGEVHESASENTFVESPIGRRRNLCGYMVPESSPEANQIHSSMNRRAVNSIVQGFASDQAMIGARVIENLKLGYYKKHGRFPDIKVCNMVHDSVEVEASYQDFMLALKYVDYALTTGVKKVVEARSGFKFNVDLEIDFEIGPNLKDMQGWDYSKKVLEKIVEDSLAFQKNELKRDIDVEEVYTKIFSQIKNGPAWLSSQVVD